MPLVLPEEVLYRQRLEAELGEYSEMQVRHANLLSFNEALKGLDPLLELVRASEQATDTALIPGCWHIRRNNTDTVPTYYPICDEYGRFKEPDSGDLERLRSLDSQGKSFEEMIDWKRREDKKKVAYQQEQRRLELAERIKQMETPSIRVTKKIHG